jgi:hypothetical protein
MEPITLYDESKRLWPNRAHAGAYRKGWHARINGLDTLANPYPHVRQLGGRVTFTQGFRGAWNDGWHAAAKNTVGRRRS